MLLRRLCLLSFLFILQSAQVLAQCSFPTVLADQFRSTALDLSIDGNDLWVATGFGVTLYDRSTDPPSPRGSLALPGTTTTVRAAGGVAYAGSGNAVYVLKKTQRAPIRVSTVEVGSQIFVTALAPPNLYLATSSGVIVVDLNFPEMPRISRTLATSTGFALSLARVGDTLYAADGDRSVEAYSVQVSSLPQRIASVAVQMNATFVSAAGSRLYVSDGLRTESFSSNGTSLTSLGVIERFGIASLAATPSGTLFTAANDRTIRGMDYSGAVPSVFFETSVTPSGGTVNRVSALAATADRLYAAAGDSGLLAYDISRFKAPFAVRNDLIGAVDSAMTNGANVIVALDGGGLREYGPASDGRLALIREWDFGKSWTVRDVNATRLLTTSLTGFKVWDLSTTPPKTVVAGTFPLTIRSAVLASDRVYAILSDRSVWQADLVIASPVRIVAAGSATVMARSGSTLLLAELTGATTAFRYYAMGDPNGPSITANLEGSIVGRVGFTNGVVAAATFRGLNLIDFKQGPPNIRSVALANASEVRSISIGGGRILVLVPGALQVRDLTSLAESGRLSLPAEGFNVAYEPGGGSFAFVVDDRGLTTVRVDAANDGTAGGGSQNPELIQSTASNAFYRKVAASRELLALFDGRRITLQRIASDGVPDSSSRILGPAAIDVAVIGSRAYGLSGSGKVTAYRSDGSTAGEYQLNEGADAVPLTIAEVAGALWVSFSRCTSGVCDSRTLVLDPGSGAPTLTATLTGRLLDSVVNGSRAYVLTNLPDEIRIFDVSVASRPALVNSRGSEGFPVSVAYSVPLATIYTLGSRVSGYDESSLSKIAELLDPYVSDGSGLAYSDQKLRILGSCALIVGRTFDPQLYVVESRTDWKRVTPQQAVGAVRSVAVQGSTIYLLSDYDLEVWSSLPPARRSRPARR